MQTKIDRSLLYPGQRWREVIYKNSIIEIVAIDEFVKIKWVMDEYMRNNKIYDFDFYQEEWVQLKNQDKV